MFSSELDPFENVRIALEGLSDEKTPDHHGGSAGTFQGSKFSMAELKRMQDVYMAEAKRLQGEVNDLEDKLDEENMAALSIPNATLSHLRSILKMKDTEDPGMANTHKMQASVTGVNLTDATTHLVSNNPDRIVRSQRLEGSCSGLMFAATFEVEEIPVKLSTIDPTEDDEGESSQSQETRRAFIRKLDLDVDPHCLDEMLPFLTEVETNCQLQPFLRGYSEYAKWFQHRHRTFTHFKKVYPDAVSLPGGANGTQMQIVCPGQQGIVYTVTWRICMEGNGRATPDINLAVLSAKEVSIVDKKKTLKRIAAEFDKMVATMGLEKALDTFLKAVILT